MQICALDDSDQIIFAHNATKQQNYICCECKGRVRLRGGAQMRTHFYHLSHNDDCRQSAKSMEHLQVQWRIQELLGKSECQLEVPFKEIKRIADVVFEQEKLVFEVQCSPIKAEEVQQRNIDYRSAGYQVIWILHDNRFNKFRISAAEMFLRSSPYYFSNINADGQGSLYDQFDIFHKGRRLFRLTPFEIDITKNKSPSLQKEYPLFLQQRQKQWDTHFANDLLDCNEPNTLQQILEHEKTYQESYFPKKEKLSAKQLLKGIFRKLILRPYLIIFRIYLEKACR
jgi:competence protein CoiA